MYGCPSPRTPLCLEEYKAENHIPEAHSTSKIPSCSASIDSLVQGRGISVALLLSDILLKESCMESYFDGKGWSQQWWSHAPLGFSAYWNEDLCSPQNAAHGFCKKLTSDQIFSFPSGSEALEPFTTTVWQWNGLGLLQVHCHFPTHSWLTNLWNPTHVADCPSMTGVGYSLGLGTIRYTKLWCRSSFYWLDDRVFFIYSLFCQSRSDTISISLPNVLRTW